MVKSLSSWKKIISAFERSNLSKAEFCKSNKLPRPKFYYWCNKLRPGLKSQEHINRSPTDSFIPIKVPPKADFFEIFLKNGSSIKFSSIPEPNWMAKFINSMDCENDQY